MPAVTLLLVLVAIRRRSRLSIDKTTAVLLTCMFYFFLRTSVEAVYLEENLGLIPALYWLNVGLLIVLLASVLTNAEWEFFVKLLAITLAVSLLVGIYQFIAFFPIRASGLSGTENHLAMQVVHVTLMLYIIYGISSRYALALHLCGLVSLSRAYIGYVLLVLARAYWRACVIAILIIVAVLMASSTIPEIMQSLSNTSPDVGDFLVQRLVVIGNQSDELGRGYARIVSHPQYLVYGAGELRREFSGDGFIGQIHSNFVSLWFCFGIPGAIFSILIIFKTLRCTGVVFGMLYVAYSMTLYFYTNIIFAIFVALLLSASGRRARVAGGG